MSAVVGGDEAEVAAAIERHGLTAANVNSAGQVVAAGTMEQLAALAADPPAKARVIPLQVAGAFHTEHMAPAVDVLGRFARAITTHDPRSQLLSNADGTIVHDGREVLRRLVAQVSNPVRWDLCHADVRRPRGHRPDRDPARRHAGQPGQARRCPDVEVLAVKTPDDLEPAREMIKAHGEPSPLAANPTWRLVVAPSKGTVELTGYTAGSQVDTGAEIARVVTLRDTYPVFAPHGGQVIEWLVENGDPVAPGQPLLRLHPVEVPAS